VDREQGEWYWSVSPEGEKDRVNDKAGFWKCPYHNGRMCLELIERIRQD
ncbi:MAG: N-acyl-D-glucosamine 2-epimerase, partial [Proteiniphilum sp.]|nr:N-acyl-D-glucosamine 2-epimerase [Proteiniphilum sp.]